MNLKEIKKALAEACANHSKSEASCFGCQYQEICWHNFETVGLLGKRYIKEERMTILNYTAHSIHIFSEEDVYYDSKCRKYKLAHKCKPMLTIESSGMVSAIYEEEKQAPIEMDGKFIPAIKKMATKVEPLPEADENTYFIVSALYASACKDAGLPTDHLLTIGSAVVSNDGRTIYGCVGLVRN